MSDQSPLGLRAYRDLIGRFATGVTVVTVHDGDEPCGMTANSIASVSLDPLLVLVCVDRAASTYERMQRAGSFAVNILSAHQRELSDFFARTARGDPMGGFLHRPGRTGSPLLKDTLGWVDCRLWQQYDGGDHTIVVDEVVDMQLARPDGAPLLFYAGGYHELAGHPDRIPG